MNYISRASVALAIVVNVITLPAAAADLPDAGKTLGGLQLKNSIKQEMSETGIVVDQTARPKLSRLAGPKVLIKGFRITGQDLLPEAQLLELLADATNSELSLADLESMAERITVHFQQKGYLVARAYIPAQEIKDHIVEISVIPGKYGKIHIEYSDKAPANHIAAKLQPVLPGSVIKQQTLERSLLLINDIPGVSVRASLSPGETTGTADLRLKISQTKPVTGSVGFDNYGNLYTGRARFATSFQLHNPSGCGDSLSLIGLTSGDEMTVGQLLYALPAGPNGGTLTFGYTRMQYTLGEDFVFMDAYGMADVKSVQWSYPLKRTQKSDLSVDIGYQTKQLQDRIGLFSDTTDKKSRSLALTLAGENREPNWVESYSAGYTDGKLEIQSPGALANDQILKTNGDFAKWNFSYFRRQFLSDRVSAIIKLTGQTANKNLDSSEKLSLGGPYAVRAHPQGEAAGDQGYLFSGELQWLLSQPRAEKQLYLATYLDAGTVMLNKKSYAGAGDNRRTLAGLGVGLIYGQADDFALRFDYAWKTNNEDETSESPRNGRFWLQGTKYF